MTSKTIDLHIYIKNKSSSRHYVPTFELLSETYGEEKVNTLKQTLDLFTSCPVSVEELGDAWLPFAGKENISEVWQIFVDESQKSSMRITLNANIETLTHYSEIECIYQGVVTGKLNIAINKILNFVFFLENELQPTVDIGRTKVSALPLKALVAICSIISHPDFDCSISLDYELLKSITNITLPEWRVLHDIELGKWILKTQGKRILQIQNFLQTTLKTHSILYRDENMYNISYSTFNNKDNLKIIYKFVSAYFQDIYDMKIYYEEGQRIVFTEKKNSRNNDSFDKFPPMMFCKAGSDKSRRYLCCQSRDWRRGITSDHPFAQWLIENAIKIKSHFPRQFQQIVDSLCNDDAPEIIKTVNEFRQQITKLNVHYGIDLASLPELTEKDFWDPLS